MTFLENVAGQIDHFGDAFIRENLAYGYDDVQKLTPFCLEKSRVKSVYFNVLAAFSAQIW